MICLTLLRHPNSCHVSITSKFYKQLLWPSRLLFVIFSKRKVEIKLPINCWWKWLKVLGRWLYSTRYLGPQCKLSQPNLKRSIEFVFLRRRTCLVCEQQSLLWGLSSSSSTWPFSLARSSRVFCVHNLLPFLLCQWRAWLY